MEPIIQLCKTRLNTDNYIYVTSKIIVSLLSDTKFSDYIESEYKRLGDTYMREAYEVFNKNRNYFEKTSNDEILCDLENDITSIYYYETFKAHNYFELKKHNIHHIIGDYDTSFRGDISDIIDLLDGNFIIKTRKYNQNEKKYEDHFYTYSKKGGSSNYVWDKIQNAIAGIYSDEYSAIIKLYND